MNPWECIPPCQLNMWLTLLRSPIEFLRRMLSLLAAIVFTLGLLKLMIFQMWSINLWLNPKDHTKRYILVSVRRAQALPCYTHETFSWKDSAWKWCPIGKSPSHWLGGELGCHKGIGGVWSSCIIIEAIKQLEQKPVYLFSETPPHAPLFRQCYQGKIHQSPGWNKIK